MIPINEGTLLWEPTDAFKEQTNIARYMKWLEEQNGLRFTGYQELWQWSTTDIESFWTSMWDFFAIKASHPFKNVLAARKMPGARWFEGATLNYAEHVFRNMTPDYPALLSQSEVRPLTEMSWEELYRSVSSVATALRNMGVQRGDRVAAYMPNIPEAVIAFLACATIGAIWSSCSPDFGSRSTIDRFKQIEPKVLFAVDGYQYGGKVFDRRSVVADLQRALPTLEKTVLISYVSWNKKVTEPEGVRPWEDLLGESGPLTFEQVPFDHPLWVLYSSGTTGLPKAIVQGHGGILIEHLKALGLHFDLKRGDRFFWFTTTGWMMWNIVVGGLLLGATVMLYDGNPAFPDLGTLWRFATATRMTFFGTGAGYLGACMKAGLEPRTTYDLACLTRIGSTASPLAPEGFQWVYQRVKEDLWLSSASGGTDVCSAFVGGCPLLPVHAGELQCRCLGVKAEAFDGQGRRLIDRVGELVITAPMPSMPLFFWNDPDNRRYAESYFDRYPGIWRHGDWIKITPWGSAVIYGRSDSTLNRMGVRMGSSEIYSAVEDVPEICDSLVVGLELPDGRYFMPLFVVLQKGTVLDEDLKARIREKIRGILTPRHVPDEIFAAPEVPRTLNLKKLEVPVKKILMGVPLEEAVNLDSMSNPRSIGYFVDLADRLNLPK